ncbi:MAG: lipocalin family protein [Muribaculaceae bacterium]|nr:lipocalin family protein [Muribaculaceae bacterium]
MKKQNIKQGPMILSILTTTFFLIGGISSAYAQDQEDNQPSNIGYTWVYRGINSSYSIEMGYGEKTEYNNKVYWKFYAKRSGNGRFIEQSDGTCTLEVDWYELGPMPQWLIREEGDVVYEVIPEAYRYSNLCEQLTGDEDPPSTFDWEMPLYDYSLEAGDQWTMLDGNLGLDDYTVAFCGEEIIDGSPSRTLNFINKYQFENIKGGIKFIEGIGITTLGCYNYMVTHVAAGFRTYGPYFIGEQLELYSVTNSAGEIIYGNRVVSGGIDTLSDKLQTQEKTYDLFGREVSDPQPGTVYIRGGKKFVAR